MTEDTPEGPRLIDLLRPSRLFSGIPARPRFVLPTLILVVSAVLYTQAAVPAALPRVIPRLLESSLTPESELVRNYRRFILYLSFVLPLFFVAVTGIAAWLLLRVTRAGRPFPDVLSLVAHSSLWVAIGLTVKALQVLATGDPQPPTTLALLFHPATRVGQLVLAFTNPFLLLALAWTARGLHAWGVPRFPALTAGIGPWAAWILLLAVGSGPGRYAPAGPISYEGWEAVETETVVLRHPPGTRSGAEELAAILDGFTRKLAARFEFEPRVLHVHAFRDHAELERATGEFLHVKVTGSIRGKDLLFLEMPGRSAAMPKERGLRDAMRYVALMHLQFAPKFRGAPRWLVEGIAHAAVEPYSTRLEREYRATLRRIGMPSFDALLDPGLFRTPDGPLLARSLLDLLVLRHGKETLAAILDDLEGGSTFRDALFSRTRLTTSALEAAWLESIRSVLRAGTDSSAPSPAGADTTAPEDDRMAPFLPRR